MHINQADFVIGLQYGDEGKGKIAASISKQVNYDLVARYNGGSNAGHTIHFESDRPSLKLHQIPSGIAFKKPGYIGPGSLVNFEKLEEEADHFKEIMNFDPFEYLTISAKAICVTKEHISLDKNHHAKTQGSTSSGIAPAYANFYNRTATLAGTYDYPHMDKSLIDDYFISDKVLFEGAQGWYLNPYQGNYPYTTSSSCSPVAAATTFGFSHKKIKNIIGVAKCYETRSGIDPTFDKVLNTDNTYSHVDKDENVYEMIVLLGNEYGVTTGRKRQVRYLDLNRLIKAINQSGTNILVLQKWDILQEVDFNLHNQSPFCYYFNGKKIVCPGIEKMIYLIKTELINQCKDLDDIVISASPVCDQNWNEIL